MENQSYINLINCNIAEASYTDIEKLAYIFEGKILLDWKDRKNSHLKKLEETKINYEKEIQVFVDKFQIQLSRIKQLNKNTRGDEKREDLRYNGISLIEWKKMKINEINKLEGDGDYVLSVCISPEGCDWNKKEKADNSIRLWDVKTGQQIQPTDKKYKDQLAQFKLPLNSNNLIAESTSYINILLISQSAIFQAEGALILQGEFINHQGFDLKQLLKSKGSIFLEEFQKKN